MEKNDSFYPALQKWQQSHYDFNGPATQETNETSKTENCERDKDYFYCRIYKTISGKGFLQLREVNFSGLVESLEFEETGLGCLGDFDPTFNVK